LRGENAAALNHQGGELAKLMRELDGGQIATSTALRKLMRIMGQILDAVRGTDAEESSKSSAIVDPIGRGAPCVVLEPHRVSVPGLVSFALTVAINGLDHEQRRNLENLCEHLIIQYLVDGQGGCASDGRGAGVTNVLRALVKERESNVGDMKSYPETIMRLVNEFPKTVPSVKALLELLIEADPRNAGMGPENGTLPLEAAFGKVGLALLDYIDTFADDPERGEARCREFCDLARKPMMCMLGTSDAIEGRNGMLVPRGKVAPSEGAQGGVGSMKDLDSYYGQGRLEKSAPSLWSAIKRKSATDSMRVLQSEGLEEELRAELHVLSPAGQANRAQADPDASAEAVKLRELVATWNTEFYEVSDGLKEEKESVEGEDEDAKDGGGFGTPEGSAIGKGVVGGEEGEDRRRRPRMC